MVDESAGSAAQRFIYADRLRVNARASSNIGDYLIAEQRSLGAHLAYFERRRQLDAEASSGLRAEHERDAYWESRKAASSVRMPALRPLFVRDYLRVQ
jgi:hypothetical protein